MYRDISLSFRPGAKRIENVYNHKSLLPLCILLSHVRLSTLTLHTSILGKKPLECKVVGFESKALGSGGNLSRVASDVISGLFNLDIIRS